MDKDEDSNIHKARDRSASAGGTACPEVDGRDSAIRVLDSHGSSKRQAADLAYRPRRKCAQQGYVVVVIFLRHARHNSQTTLPTHGKQGWSWHPYRMPVPVLRYIGRRRTWRCRPLPVSLKLASVGSWRKITITLIALGQRFRPGVNECKRLDYNSYHFRGVVCLEMHASWHWLRHVVRPTLFVPRVRVRRRRRLDRVSA